VRGVAAGVGITVGGGVDTVVGVGVRVGVGASVCAWVGWIDPSKAREIASKGIVMIQVSGLFILPQLIINRRGWLLHGLEDSKDYGEISNPGC
jgi:hypothetical protein